MIVNQVGPPVRGSNCFGRETTLDLIWEKLSSGHVLLTAPRRFGKTSVMYRLVDSPRWDYKVFLADLEPLTEPADFVTKLVELALRDPELAPYLRKLSFLPKKIWSAFRECVEEIELYKLRIKLREDLRPRWQAGGDEFFAAVAESTYPTVFILDEFPVMIDGMSRTEAGGAGARSLLHWLRAVRQSPARTGLRFLVGGSIGLANVLKRIGEVAAINDFEQIRLEPFTAQAAEIFLGKLCNGVRMPLSDASQRTILDAVGIPVAYFIQVLFSEVRKTHLQTKEAITPAMIQTVYRDKVLGVECKTYFDHYYGRLREYYSPETEKTIKRILRELAVAGQMSRDACYQIYTSRTSQPDPEEFNALMDELENDFYIRFEAGAQRYGFSCKILRDWWLRHYGMKLEA